MQIKPINILLICLGCFVGGYLVGKWLSKPKTETITVKEIQVVKDTVEANMYRDQAAALRIELFRLKQKKQEIIFKYDSIYIYLDRASDATIDSIYTAIMRQL